MLSRQAILGGPLLLLLILFRAVSKAQWPVPHYDFQTKPERKPASLQSLLVQPGIVGTHIGIDQRTSGIEFFIA